MGDLDSISRGGRQGSAATHERLDILVNNAGLMATPEQQTAPGIRDAVLASITSALSR